MLEPKHIRIVSPSGAIDPAYIDDASVRLLEWGFAVSEGRYARTKAGRFAGTDLERVSDLNEALQDPEADYVLCSRGGYGLQRIIDRVVPISKPIIGFSDITCLHQLAAMQHTPSLHALMCKHIATLDPASQPIECWREALVADCKSLIYKQKAHPFNRVGEVQSTIIGGNLSVLYGLQGTPFGLTALLPTYTTPPILFIEDIAERHYHIDRMLHNLRLSGVFEQIGGLIVGQFTDCQDDPAMGCTVMQTIREAVDDYSFPVLFDFPAGHVEQNMPLWFGTPAILAISEEGSVLSVQNAVMAAK